MKDLIKTWIGKASLFNTIRALGVAALFLAGQAQASVIWSATATSSFKSLEEQDCDGNYHSDNGSSVTIVSDPTYGNVFQFRKVSDDRRCEAKGASGVTITQGQTYYIGWRFKLSSLVNDNSIFQWKSYGSPMNQNYPFVIKMINNQLNLEHYQSGGTRVTLWKQTVSANTWYSLVLRIYVSSSASSGTVQFWFGGDSTPETLLTGGTSYTCKTFDGSTIDPKWGKYGACGTQIDSYVDDLKIGTTYADVVPGGGGGGDPIAGFKRIVARHSGKDVVVQSASTADGANIFQYTYASGSTRNDEWEIISVGSGYYRIMNRHSGKAMVVEGASTADGADIIQWTYGGSNTNDEWQFVDVGSGYYRIVNRNSGKVADVLNSGTGNGVDIRQETWDGGNNQQFQLITIP